MKTWWKSAKSPSVSTLFTTDAEADSGAKISPQRWIARHLFIKSVGQILSADVRRNSRVHAIPHARIHHHISRRMSDSESEEVRVGATADEASAQISSPARAEVIDERRSGMLGTAK